jgi:hypothetical protein
MPIYESKLVNLIFEKNMKVFISMIMLLTLSACAKEDNNAVNEIHKLMCSGFNYGYSLPKATNYSASGLAKSKHTHKSANLKYIAENRYCIAGVVLKAMGKPKSSCSDIENFRIEDVTELARLPFVYIGYGHLVQTKK